MNQYLPLGKFSFGMGDRFGHQGRAQLRACLLATGLGAHFVPVWNKSNREHTFISTEPSSLRAEADDAVKALGWENSMSGLKRWTALLRLRIFLRLTWPTRLADPPALRT
jgi:hypothetical protein